MIRNKSIVLWMAALIFSCVHIIDKSDAVSTKNVWRAPTPEEIPFGQSIEVVSQLFLGAPFVDNALGEGPGHHDSDPTFRLDAFDCTTFVESVWAMSFSSDHGKNWTKDLQLIRYRNGEIDFTQRLHFISLDWMPYHEKRSAIVDITNTLGIPVAESITSIDRIAWYKKMHPTELSEYERRNPGKKPELVALKYLTFKELLENIDGMKKLKMELKKGAILANFIRPNWDTVKFIGTRIDVSHQGFLILKGDHIVLRHASAVLGKVGDEDFLNYMKYYKNHATLKGIQIVQLKSL